jgi:uncharacterized membrane protein
MTAWFRQRIPARPIWDWLWQFALRHRAALAGTAFGLVLLNVRWRFSGHFEFGFLLWNLFLAWLPLGFAELLTLRLKREQWFRPANVALAIAWLLFFPNAPYLLTDVLHWHPRRDAPPWLDLMLLLHFALLGTALGFASLRVVRRVVAARCGPWVAHGFTVAALLAASFGIYLGRFQRWNSWSVLTAPDRLSADILSRLLWPWEHPRTWGFTLAMTGVLLSLWWAWNSAGRSPRRWPRITSPAANRSPV